MNDLYCARRISFAIFTAQNNNDVRFLRLFTRNILLLLHVCIAAVFLVACLVPFIGPDQFWPISFLGLMFPYIVLVLLAFFFLWAFIKPKYCLISLLCMFAGWKSLAVMFAFHPTDTGKDSVAGIKVMSYNVRYFKDFEKSPRKNRVIREGIMNMIEEQSPDILCLQEFYTSESPLDNDNKEDISRRMDLPYRYFSSDHNYKNNHSGVILFSRFPIIRSGKLKLLQNSPYESAIFADIVRKNDTIRIFTVHLQSIYLSHKDLAGIELVKAQEDTGFVASMAIVSKLRKAFLKREFQAQTLSDQIKSSPYPVIVCGDFNDTPNSYAYFKIRNGLQDAFLQKGFGLGRTYAGIAPTLRIDYIFVSPGIRVHSFERIKEDLSDHYPIISRVSLNNDG